MRRLYAGPWVGEFGWELMGWQGVIRYLAPDYDKVIIIGQLGHGFLYEDFADNYLEHNLSGDNPNMWLNDEVDWAHPLRNQGDIWIQPQQLTLMDNAPQQTFVKYGEKNTKDAFNIVCHARNISKYESDYINFPINKWEELIIKCDNMRIVSIGTEDGAYHVPGTIDLRGISLKDTTNILASSDLLIGPSSGPMHLGALCGIPTLVWSGYAKSRPRYESAWNPFKTQVKVISPPGDPWENKEEWQPELEEILNAVGDTQWRN